ncbi:MAG: hypothetical protein M3R27_08365 [Bacteroidota bacterium]|nr:hypothetical protein [Bacteroidota bacterium]
MKKIFTLLLILQFSLSLFSQGVDYKYDSKHILEIKKSTIYIIPTGDKNFDDSLNYYVAKCWKVSPYKVITREEADLLLKEESNYFLAAVPALGNDGFGTKSTVKAPISDYAKSVYIFHGSKKSKFKSIEYQNALYCRLPFYGKDNYTAGLGYVVKNLNDNVELIIELLSSNKISGVNSPSKEWIPTIRTEFSKRANPLKEKTLLIDSKAKEIHLKENVMKAYKYSYKIVTTSEMLSLLNSQLDKYCFLAADAEMDIYDAESNNLIFSLNTRTGSGSIQITEKHIQKLNTSIAKP